MKYHPSRTLTEFAAKEFSSVLLAENYRCCWDAVTAIPSSARSFRTRLFNQSGIIARLIAKDLNLPFRPTLLTHRGYRAPQASLRGKRRFSNVKHCFLAAGCEGMRIALVDDVITTGATVAAAAKALRRAGAHSVEIVALARSERWIVHLNALDSHFGLP
jgi:predicted amidophosphoribosyltransferase